MIGRDGIRFTVQGDQVSLPDGVLPAAQVYGRVTAIERAGAPIDMSRAGLRVLGWAAALRSRSGISAAVTAAAAPTGWLRD